MFGNWLYGVPKKDKNKIRIGISAICWTIWNTRNEMIFNNQKGTNFLQVIFRADTVMGFPATGGSAQGYGYWLQQTAGGHAGFLLPGYWVAT